VIEILGAALDELPSVSELTAALKKQFLFAHRDCHGEIRNERAARASLAGLLLLQASGARGDLSYDDRGRPRLSDASCDFNITHTDAYAFCALETATDGVGTCRVGVDAEDLSRLSRERGDRLAERWFSEAEKAVFEAAPSEECFLRIWTRKEALMKWIGTGLVDLPRADTVSAESAYGIRFTEYRVGETLITLCLRAGAVAPPRIRMLSEFERYVR